MRVLAGVIAAMIAGSVAAEAVEESLRPIARVQAPAIDRTGAEARAEWFVVPQSVQAVALSQRPARRTPEVRAAATARTAALQAGSVCGDVALQGDRMGSHPGPGACGVEDAVRLRSVAGVTLSTPAIVDCTTARALRAWVENGLVPAVGDEGGGVASLRVVAHYACRSRNNQAGARLSEHANGRAIDIAGIGLRNGREITVLTDWNAGEDGQRLRRMWRTACGPFGTVLGPEANRFHLDHFHFDTARYRSGTYCR